MKAWRRINQLACKAWAFCHSFGKLWLENQVSIRAAALTYTFILSLVPALALIFAMISFFADIRSHQAELQAFLMKNLATGTGESVVQFIDKGLRNLRFKTIGVWGLGGLMITGMLLLSAIQGSMNHIWRSERKQRVWARIILYQAFFALGPVGISLAMAALAVVAKIFPKFFYPTQIASILLCATLFSAMYKLLPATYVRWKNAIIAGLVAAVALEISKRGFAIYTTKAISYNKVYGGFAALPLFLIWIQINWLIFLSCTQLNYMLDRGIGWPKASERIAS